ncbi:MAG TPA: Maf family nucleotide pyrophosphatase [Saprospiraceae bacterium]|nr:Maf family nucleotide pyrophosphatase [Saprospiraceae bacterium]
MNTKVNLRKIILASSSPRRKQLLEEAGFWFDSVFVDFDENYPDHLAPFQVAQYLAEEKARSAMPFVQGNDILLTADSIVVLGDRIFGKPADEKEAYLMLATLSGKKHVVYTGVCLRDDSKMISFTGTSEVFFRELNHAEIVWYINQYKPYDKAGSYAVQEWIGLCKISHITGTYANIMGLPTDLVYEGLKSFPGAIAFEP